MKTYPSIPARIEKNRDFYVFDKLDGSNIRTEWSKKKGFYKFGTRKRMLDESEPIFGRAKDIWLDKYGDDVSKILIENRIERAVMFFEFWGPRSFAGYHHEDDDFAVTLFDINVYKVGLIPPREFLKLFGGIDHAPLLYHGKVNHELVTKIRNGKLEGMTYEGVICKAEHPKKGKPPIMFKVKSQKWYDRLKKKCAEDPQLFEELS